jgi:hypothetical protein
MRIVSGEGGQPLVTDLHRSNVLSPKNRVLAERRPQHCCVEDACGLATREVGKGKRAKRGSTRGKVQDALSPVEVDARARSHTHQLRQVRFYLPRFAADTCVVRKRRAKPNGRKLDGDSPIRQRQKSGSKDASLVDSFL